MKTMKEYVESKGMIFMSTPFSRAAADRMGVSSYKIGSGECNNSLNMLQTNDCKYRNL